MHLRDHKSQYAMRTAGPLAAAVGKRGLVPDVADVVGNRTNK